MVLVLVLLYCCISLLFPSIHDDIYEFLATFGKGERGEVFYIPLSSLKIVDCIYTSQHCVALVLGLHKQQQNQLSHEKICALVTIQREYLGQQLRRVPRCMWGDGGAEYADF